DGIRGGGVMVVQRCALLMLLVALRGGAPLSVTRTVIRLVLGPYAYVGVQLSTPVLASRRTPVGAETRPKLSVLLGRSASLAVLRSEERRVGKVGRSAGSGRT